MLCNKKLTLKFANSFEAAARGWFCHIADSLSGLVGGNIEDFFATGASSGKICLDGPGKYMGSTLWFSIAVLFEMSGEVGVVVLS